MRYTTPLYELEVVNTVDAICASAAISTYKDSEGNTVQEMDYSFSNIFNKK